MLGIIGMMKGREAGGPRVALREGQVGSDDRAAHAVLAEAGRHSAIALIRCTDEAMWRKVGAQAAERGIRTWTGSLTELLDGLDEGSHHDWVRTALGRPEAS